MGHRTSGILCHITSLPSAYGIGDLGPRAYAFADFLVETHQSYWQILPLTPTSAANSNSPYNGLSAFAGNTLLISPELLIRDGLLEEDAQPTQPTNNSNVEFDQVVPEKRALLHRAVLRFQEKGTDLEFGQFCREHAEWLEDYALFSVLLEKLQKPICEWPVGVRDREPQALDDMRAELMEEIRKEKILQYLFFRQWGALKSYCNERGIQLIGDFPFFMNYDSADVWTHAPCFKLDQQKKALAVAGSPPDNFAEKGQLFSCCVYDWEQLKKESFSWWVRRLKHMFWMYDRTRIDHFRGLIAYWEVPASDADALKGKWQEAAFYDFMKTLLRHTPNLPIIAEDLGVITADVREAMAAYLIPGIKVLLLAFSKEMYEVSFLPHHHISNTVVYTGTHDTNTCRGWFEKNDNPEDKEIFFTYIGRETERDVHWEYIKLALMSVADTAIIPLQDLLGLGEEARMNTPGQLNRSNWVWRVGDGQISEEVKLRLSEMTRTYGRD